MISAMAAKKRAQPIPIEECSVSKSGFKEVVKAPRGKMWKKFMVSPNFSSGAILKQVATIYHCIAL